MQLKLQILLLIYFIYNLCCLCNFLIAKHVLCSCCYGKIYSQTTSFGHLVAVTTPTPPTLNRLSLCSLVVSIASGAPVDDHWPIGHHFTATRRQGSASIASLWLCSIVSLFESAMYVSQWSPRPWYDYHSKKPAGMQLICWFVVLHPINLYGGSSYMFSLIFFYCSYLKTLALVAGVVHAKSWITSVQDRKEIQLITKKGSGKVFTW
jgi:hypothetical protein